MKTITFTPSQEKVFKDAIWVYGVPSQLTQTNEESTELSLALLKYKRAQDHGDASEIEKRRKELLSEIADVIIMTQQCVLIFGAEEIQQEVNFKLRRQRTRIDNKLSKLAENA
jgi:hypothetical protein